MLTAEDKIGFIFDLDQTLFATDGIKPYRDSRQWPTAFNMARNTFPDAGIVELIKVIKNSDCPITIVTRSPRRYAEIFARKLGIGNIIAYQDVSCHYNKIEGYQKAAYIMGVSCHKIVVVGDDDKGLDLAPVHRLGMTGVQARWYAKRMRSVGAQYCCDTIEELIDLVKNDFFSAVKGGKESWN